jgi:SAM-dependent methyltransferase
MSAYERDVQGKSVKDIFNMVYARKIWGTGDQGQLAFSSGSGSHLPLYVDPYVKAMETFFASLDHRPDLVDLGCGDFNIGSRIRPFCNRYTAIDVAADLIRDNQQKYASLDVDFRCADIIEEPLPGGEVLIIRQVLQHLSNEHIQKIVSKIRNYRYLVLTEYIPKGTFAPNLDQATGAYSRLARGIPSGVVLTAPPFFFAAQSERILCDVEDRNGIVRTLLYDGIVTEVS